LTQKEPPTAPVILRPAFLVYNLDIFAVTLFLFFQSTSSPLFEAIPAESAARVVPKNLRRLMLPGEIGSFVIFFPSAQKCFQPLAPSAVRLTQVRRYAAGLNFVRR
jgi:hypothetical protein